MFMQRFCLLSDATFDVFVEELSTKLSEPAFLDVADKQVHCLLGNSFLAAVHELQNYAGPAQPKPAAALHASVGNQDLLVISTEAPANLRQAKVLCAYIRGCQTRDHLCCRHQHPAHLGTIAPSGSHD